MLKITKRENPSTNLFVFDGLFGCFEEFIYNLFRFKSDEAESFSLVFRFVKWHFDFDDLQKQNMNKNLTKNKYILLTVPYCPKYCLMSSSDNSDVKPPTKIFPCLALAFFGSTFLLLMVWSVIATTLSIASACLNTIKANPLDLPVVGSVFTFILSISPYCPKWSRNSSGK